MTVPHLRTATTIQVAEQYPIDLKKVQMKNLRTSVLCVCITLFSLCSAAQVTKVPVNEPDYNRPKLFANLPETIPVSIDNLDNLVNTKTGITVNTVLSTDSKTAPFDGKVVSAVSKYNDKIQSVVIQSANYNGATLTLSRIVKDDGAITYTGRLISFQHGDLYVLQQKDGGFVLVKKNFYDLVNE